jgi:DNA-binding response OmpR family regulator
MANVLVIEDEPSVLVALRDSLESEGHVVQVATDGEQGYGLAARPPAPGGPDLIILDLMLPRLGGLELCRRLRASGNDRPVIILTARSAPADAALGLKLGADDYIGKPFDVSELLARVQAVLRRSARQGFSTVRIGDLEVDLRRLKATRRGEPVDFSPREMEILDLLIARRGETVSREELLQHIWGRHASFFSRTIDAHIARLRQKIEREPGRPEHIVTVHGVGYRLVAD